MYGRQAASVTSESARPVRVEPTAADPDLYPDLAASGSLAEALERVAAEHGLELGAEIGRAHV